MAKRKKLSDDEKLELARICSAFVTYLKEKTDGKLELKPKIVEATPKKPTISRVGAAGYVWRMA